MDVNRTIAALSRHAHSNEEVTACPTIVAELVPEHGFERGGVGGSAIGSPKGDPIGVPSQGCPRIRGYVHRVSYPPPPPPENGLSSLPYFAPSATHSRAGLPPLPVDLLHFSSGATNPSLCNTLR